MNGSFGHHPPSRFLVDGNGDGFHQHSENGGGHHLSMDFDMMPQHQSQHQHQQHQPSSDNGGGVARLPNGSASYESHDDLCIDQCSGVGLYNGSGFFNHRGAPAASAFPPRWPGRVAPAPAPGPSRDTLPPLYHYTMGLDDLSMQFRPSPDPYQPWFVQQLQSGLHASDDDCRSMGDMSCCDSQCTMTGKCTNMACANKEDACTDQSCPGRPESVPSEVVDGAAALISINHAPEQQQPHRFGFQPSSGSYSSSPAPGGALARVRGQVMDFGTDFLHDPNWRSLLGGLASHILVAHPIEDTANENCTRPCPLDDPRNYLNCHIPAVYNNPPPFSHYGSGNGAPMLMSRELPVCGAETDDPDAFLAHFNTQHRPFFTGDPQSLMARLGCGDEAILPSTEDRSPSSATPLDTTDSGISSNTPDPLTPLSNSMDMSDVKDSASSLSRSQSVSSSVGTPVGTGPDDEHKCLWQEEGSTTICGRIFEDSGELFVHAADAHIRVAGAVGFPQRSKIERHMQTHIGHKPHICPTCHKGFSAKQALNQHIILDTPVLSYNF
ncbi:hypothetical protein B0H63DRAFT_444270 [Podospora didyma]|uniref:C2H2-type domain-containing protein n=1 Tax=Podospora didyma TaxID=330526 RepID=A0AAE0P6U9_9PEZI|nr:hypothetical protein B0H63DRAFT_444270 [Podospora didyma]